VPRFQELTYDIANCHWELFAYTVFHCKGNINIFKFIATKTLML